MEENNQELNLFSIANITVPSGEEVSLHNENVTSITLRVPRAADLKSIAVGVLNNIVKDGGSGVTCGEMIDVIKACSKKELCFDQCSFGFIVALFKEALPFFVVSLQQKKALTVDYA